MDGSPKWYQNPLFDRYWHHYRETLGWFQRHKQVLYELEHGVESSCERDGACERRSGSKRWQGRYDESRKRRRSVAEPPSPLCNDEGDYSDDQHGPEEELEMEVTEEMIAFFAQSERHRRELRAARESRDNEDKAREEGSTALSGPRPNDGPMSAGQRLSRRTAEMKSLYGKSAAMIHGMETAMQLSCDRFRDTKQPKHWPNIPLKL
ncbi:gem-associated protein 8 [Ixodes scapularis]